ncbi:MAG TPA: hypothetical protein PLV68_06590, partial [Ilumatobacteraceae bacterium]|nr:hypothetical protein [Ilumatobacteraceae bacterium]
MATGRPHRNEGTGILFVPFIQIDATGGLADPGMDRGRRRDDLDPAVGRQAREIVRLDEAAAPIEKLQGESDGEIVTEISYTELPVRG